MTHTLSLQHSTADHPSHQEHLLLLLMQSRTSQTIQHGHLLVDARSNWRSTKMDPIYSSFKARRSQFWRHAGTGLQHVRTYTRRKKATTTRLSISAQQTSINIGHLWSRVGDTKHSKSFTNRSKRNRPTHKWRAIMYIGSTLKHDGDQVVKWRAASIDPKHFHNYEQWAVTSLVQYWHQVEIVPECVLSALLMAQKTVSHSVKKSLKSSVNLLA